MRRNLWLSTILVSLLLISATVWVGITIGPHFLAARAALSPPLTTVDDDRMAVAIDHLEAAASRLDSLPAQILMRTPLIGPNLEAMEAVAISLPEALEEGRDLKIQLDSIHDEGLIQNGRLRNDIPQLMGPLLEQQELALARVVQTALHHRKGALVPPLWDALDEVAHRAAALEMTTRKARGVLRHAEALLGRRDSRRYLVLLLNNAELRGAGGILTGVGTISISEGRIELEEMHSVHDLQTERRRRVPAPDDFRRRFGRYDADTTLWLNTSYSPDVPDVALVAARLFERVRGVSTDGAVIVDPRGISALLPEGTTVDVPRLGSIGAEDLPELVYSEAYGRFSNQDRRRSALLQAGQRALEAAIDEGLRRLDLQRAGDAVAGGHLRFVSFDDEESGALDAAEVSGAMAAPEGDTVRVVAQNWGDGRSDGTKLDHHTSRAISHRCTVAEDGGARCRTEITLRNEAPSGLPRYVAGRPLGLLRTLLEAYLPGEARVAEVELDGDPAEVRLESQMGHTVISTYIETPREAERTLRVTYHLDGQDGYRLTISPQPLSQDARIDLAVALPEGWTVIGPATENEQGVLAYQGSLDRRIIIRAEPSRKTGISAAWARLVRFWTKPIF